MADIPIQPKLLEAINLIAMRLNTETSLPWLLGGPVAQVLQGVERALPQELLILTGAAEVGRVAALLSADETEPLAIRAAPGFGPSPRGRYNVKLADEALVPLELVGDAEVVGRQGTISLALERIWPLRITWRQGDSAVPLVSLEVELASELLRGHATEAHAIASYLLARGAQWEHMDRILAQAPTLEEPLWELMDAVRPMAKRARGKRKRRQIGWGGQRR